MEVHLPEKKKRELQALDVNQSGEFERNWEIDSERGHDSLESGQVLQCFYF